MEGITQGGEAGLTVGASAAAIRSHYDLGNPFYEILLGRSMVYSCGLWSDGADLEEAQLAKIDLIAAMGGVRPGSRVLDIGCGWGAAAARMVQTLGARSAVGLTLSEEQAAWARHAAVDDVEILVQDWATYVPDDLFDAAISIGAFEHFARPGLPRRTKVAAYSGFFASVHRLLAPGGRLGLQTMAVGHGRLRSGDAATLKFLARYIFPESNLPRLDQIVEASLPHFELRELVNHREHYASTCRAWLRRLEAHRSDAERIAGPEVVDQYFRYLDSVSDMFDRGQVLLLRMSLQRVD